MNAMQEGLGRQLNTYAETNYAFAKVGRKGDPFSKVTVVAARPVESNEAVRKWRSRAKVVKPAKNSGAMAEKRLKKGSTGR